MSANFAEIESALVEKEFELTEATKGTKTYAKWNTSDKGWTEIILDSDYNEVIKDIYGADNRQLNHTAVDVKSTQAVFRLIG